MDQSPVDLSESSDRSESCPSPVTDPSPVDRIRVQWAASESSDEERWADTVTDVASSVEAAAGPHHSESRSY
jgi:hypothetical protein